MNDVIAGLQRFTLPEAPNDSAILHGALSLLGPYGYPRLAQFANSCGALLTIGENGIIGFHFLTAQEQKDFWS